MPILVLENYKYAESVKAQTEIPNNSVVTKLRQCTVE
jgi:hypothetical protein